MIADLTPRQAKQDDFRGIPWAGSSRYIGLCSECRHFEACRVEKGINETSDYCHWHPTVRRFESKRLP